MANAKIDAVTSSNYHFGVRISQEGKDVYSGPCKLDTVYAKLPKSGTFAIELEHGNPRGFAKMFHHFVASSSLIGIKAISPAKVDWYECALTGLNVPAKVIVTFDNPNAASIMLYALSIPTVVPGGWKDTNKDAGISLSNILHHSQESGIKRLCTEGTGGKRILTAKGTVTGAMIEQFNAAKKALTARAHEESSKPTKVVKTKVKAKAKDTKPKLTPEQAEQIRKAREDKPQS
jgi:hypothetical protein